MRNHAFAFSALFITCALFPLPEFLLEKDPDSTPNPRHLEEIAYDNHREALFLFGGAELHGSSWTEPSNCFEYKTGWLEKQAKGPIGRRGHAMVYDESSKAIVVIGGVAQIAEDTDTVLFDTWSWKNGKWTLIDSKCPVKEPRAVYNADDKSVLVYGDVLNLTKSWRGGDERKFELWEFRKGQWKKLSANGPAGGPFPLAYNRDDKSLSALEWTDNSRLILWEWKSEKWNKTEFDANIPESRNKYSFTYSNSENSLFLFGGVDSNRNLLSDFWKYDGKRWTKIETTVAPSSRASLRLIDAGDKLLLYGGVKKEGLTNELWEFKGGHWKKL